MSKTMFPSIIVVCKAVDDVGVVHILNNEIILC